MNELQQHATALVLASQSPTRARLLESAGLSFQVVPPAIDESAVKEAVLNGNDGIDAADLSLILAQTKAASVSETQGSALVIGADQVLACDGTLFDKPRDRDDARRQLVTLRGTAHALHTSVACAEGGEVLWHTHTQATLTMRDFSNEFLGQYMALVGADLTASVGGYQLEGPGAQLFDAVDGDYFSILGLPLLPLLSFLRQRGVIAA